MTETVTAETATADGTTFGDLLARALVDPGTVSQAYRAFHGYSLGNQLLAMGQCLERGIPIGPIASFNRWKELGRSVSKGSKAIALWMPITGKRTVDDGRQSNGRTVEAGDTVTFTRFVTRRNWFVLAQTNGQDYVPAALPDWTEDRALAALDVTREPFGLMDGNTQGYARARTVAVSPLAQHPEKTLFHELAHVVLGHTAEATTMRDDERTPRSLREVEAEGVAMLCGAALGLPGVEESRGYMQHWAGMGEAIPEASARKIFKAADQILKAGRPVESKGEV
jgi:hypothetical protein